MSDTIKAEDVLRVVAMLRKQYRTTIPLAEWMAPSAAEDRVFGDVPDEAPRGD